MQLTVVIPFLNEEESLKELHVVPMEVGKL